jgi:dolichyl-diphosphooligosaccharide--protein glycosyltransferase
MSASYFAGVMVRLMLTLTPVVCVLAAIAFSRTLEIYLKDEVKKSTRDDIDDREHDKFYDKVRL